MPVILVSLRGNPGCLLGADLIAWDAYDPTIAPKGCPRAPKGSRYSDSVSDEVQVSSVSDYCPGWDLPQEQIIRL